MIYRNNTGQVSNGEAIGILLLDSPIPFIPGDVANATSYDFPVRFQKVKGFSVEKVLDGDATIYPELLNAAKELKANGVRAITGDCGFMALHQNRLKNELEIPVFLSSLLQIHFIRNIIAENHKIGVITANSKKLNCKFFKNIGINDYSDLIIEGLEDCKEFKTAVLEEKGTLDSDAIKKEVLSVTDNLCKKDLNIKAILLECSVLPSYAKAVQEKTELPVFDYNTMINYVFNSLIKKSFKGFM